MPIIKVGDQYADLDLAFLGRHLALLDGELSDLNAKIERSADGESEGLFDAAEYFIGSGLVAIQRYLTATRASLGIEVARAFEVGPKVTNELTVVRLLNAGANYWKHMEEWFEVLNRTEAAELRAEARRTLEQLEAVSPWEEYTCSNLLAAISNSHGLRLAPLLPLLIEWRNTLFEGRV